MYFVYAIYNKKHNKIYIGQTKDLQNRLKIHNEGLFKNSYTSRFDGEWVIIYSESKFIRKDSFVREKQLKSYRGRQFIKGLIPIEEKVSSAVAQR